MGTTRTPRAKWIEAGLRALAAGGPEAVRIEPLAQTLGVTKGGFYGYFRNRETLLTELLDTWERGVAQDVICEVESGGGDARTKLVRLFALAGSASNPVTSPAAELAVRDWARRDEGVAQRLRRVDNQRMDYLRTLFGEFCPDQDEVEVRCMMAFSLRIGNHLIAADNGPRSRADLMALIGSRLLA